MFLLCKKIKGCKTNNVKPNFAMHAENKKKFTSLVLHKTFINFKLLTP